MNFSEFKKFFNIEKEFERQKIINDYRLLLFIKKAKRSFFGLGILSSILCFTLISSSYDNYLKIKNYLFAKAKIMQYRSHLFSKRRTKLNFLIEFISENV